MSLIVCHQIHWCDRGPTCLKCSIVLAYRKYSIQYHRFTIINKLVSELNCSTLTRGTLNSCFAIHKWDALFNAWWARAQWQWVYRLTPLHHGLMYTDRHLDNVRFNSLTFNNNSERATWRSDSSYPTNRSHTSRTLTPYIVWLPFNLVLLAIYIYHLPLWEAYERIDPGNSSQVRFQRKIRWHTSPAVQLIVADVASLLGVRQRGDADLISSYYFPMMLWKMENRRLL